MRPLEGMVGSKRALMSSSHRHCRHPQLRGGPGYQLRRALEIKSHGRGLHLDRVRFVRWEKNSIAQSLSSDLNIRSKTV